MKAALKNSFALVGFIKAARQIPFDLRRFKWCRARPGVIASYLQSHPVRKLQLGAGPNHLDGWLNTDFSPRNPQQIYLDASQPFPFPDATFDYIFTEHMIEHLVHRDGMTLLRESRRILKPGGKIRISTPNLENIARLSGSTGNELHQKYIKRATDKYIPENTAYLPGFVINNFFWDFGHYFVYDPQTLPWAMTAAGFTNIQRRDPGQSDDPGLTGIETHGQVIGEDMNRFESMVFEAVRA